MEHCVATCPIIRPCEQLYRAPYRCFKDLQTCEETNWRSCRDNWFLASDLGEFFVSAQLEKIANDTLQSIISWIGAVTNATLIYLFRPSTTLNKVTPNPNIPSTGSVYLHQILAKYDISDTWAAILPTLIPLVAVALAASHGFIVLRWAVESVAERLLWRGSDEEIQVQKMTARSSIGLAKQMREMSKRTYAADGLRDGFWNGGEEGARAIGSVGKAE